MGDFNEDPLTFLVRPEVCFQKRLLLLLLKRIRVNLWRTVYSFEANLHVSRLQGKATFLRDSWEKKAAHFSAKDAPRSQLKDVLDVKHLCTVLDDKEEKGQCLRFGIDCCAMAYIDGERGDLGGSTGEVLDSNEAQSLYSMGATLQVRNSISSNMCPAILALMSLG